MGNKHVNAIVVGAGAGGGIVAKELSVAGLSVVLFERGGWATFDDTDTDELKSQRTTPLGNAYGPDDERYIRVIENADGSTYTVLPSEGGYNNNAACVGSGTVSYGAMAWRFMQEDFKLKTTYGAIEGSTLADWPFTYEDLEPCYEKAEWEIGVAGDATQNPFGAPRNKPYPMPPFSHNKEAQLLYDAAKRLGYHPFPIPMLRNSVPYGGRPACIRMRTCCGYACPVNAKCGTQNTVIPVAIATGNCELRINSVVSEINVNENDWVGRNLQGHAYTGAYGIFEDEVYDDLGPGASVAISDFNHHNPGIMGGGVLCNEFIRMPYSFTGIRPPGAARWGKEHKTFQRLNFKRVAQAVGPYQEIPNFDAKVGVDPVVKDFWGIPVVRLSGSRHEKDIEGCRLMSEKAELWLKEAGAIQTWQSLGGGKGISGGQHQAGTCRMGNDPKTSVTDKYGRIHAVPNLFVADGSLNVNNGGFNPALTIMALGFRVGGYIASEWSKGNRFK